MHTLLIGMPGKIESSSFCVLVPCPAASAKMDNSNLTKNGEITVFWLEFPNTFCKKRIKIS